VVALRPVHVVVPAGIDDPAEPSGGNAYDRRICSGLPAAGWSVQEHAVAGSWPRPDAASREALARCLAAVPDGGVVLVDGLVACGVPEVVVPAAQRLALVVLLHLPLGDEAGAAPELARRERATLEAASAVVATSPWAVRRLVALHGLPADRMHVAVPGVDPAPEAPGTDGTTLRSVGAITPTKGHDLLVAALAPLGDLAFRCELVGPVHRDPEHVAALRQAIARHGLADRVRLRGPLRGAALEEAYATTDLLVLPSRAEAYGMVVTEALARGVPVLATDVGGVAQALGTAPDGRVPGILVPPGDDAQLTAALRRWLGEPGLRARLRDAARARRGTLDGWEVTTRCLAAALERLPGTPG
jgi:glycosyltransferase involved in cell wall biosynthesis